MVDCQHYEDVGSIEFGRCRLGLFGGMPSHGVCLHVCPERLPHGATEPVSPTKAPRPAPPPQPVPRDQWPLAVRGVAKMAQEGDQGVGDTLQRLLAHVGGEQYKRMMKRIGIDCGCAASQAHLNALYPYVDAAPPTG